MTFASIVRACTALGCLREHQIALALDALDGKEVELTDVDRAA